MMQSLLSGGALGGGFLAGGAPGALAGGAGLLAPNLIARALTGGFGGKTLRNYLANQVGADTTMQQRLGQALIGAVGAR